MLQGEQGRVQFGKGWIGSTGIVRERMEGRLLDLMHEVLLVNVSQQCSWVVE